MAETCFKTVINREAAARQTVIIDFGFLLPPPEHVFVLLPFPAAPTPTES